MQTLYVCIFGNEFFVHLLLGLFGFVKSYAAFTDMFGSIVKCMRSYFDLLYFFLSQNY